MVNRFDVGDTLMVVIGVVASLVIAIHGSGVEDFMLGSAPFIFIDCAISSFFMMKLTIFNVLKKAKRNGRS